MFSSLFDVAVGYAICVLFPMPFLSQAILNAYAWVWSKLFPVKTTAAVAAVVPAAPAAPAAPTTPPAA